MWDVPAAFRFLRWTVRPCATWLVLHFASAFLWVMRFRALAFTQQAVAWKQSAYLWLQLRQLCTFTLRFARKIRHAGKLPRQVGAHLSLLITMCGAESGRGVILEIAR